MNKTLGSLLFDSSCSILIGDRGSGKSCLTALAVREFQKAGYRIFSNYPYRGAFEIPYKNISTKYGDKLILDKEFLYKNDFHHSLVVIDEARTVWNARAYASWNENDEEFFNFIRKNDTYVLLCTQRYDGLDLNIRCAADYTFYIQRSRFFKNISWVDVSRSIQLKVADTNSRVVSKGFSRNATKVVWDIGEVPIKYSMFYRKPFYDDFDTYFSSAMKQQPEQKQWKDPKSDKRKDKKSANANS